MPGVQPPRRGLSCVLSGLAAGKKPAWPVRPRTGGVPPLSIRATGSWSPVGTVQDRPSRQARLVSYAHACLRGENTSAPRVMLCPAAWVQRHAGLCFFFQGRTEIHRRREPSDSFPALSQTADTKLSGLLRAKGRPAPRPAAWVQRYAGLCFFLSRKKGKRKGPSCWTALSSCSYFTAT